MFAVELIQPVIQITGMPPLALSLFAHFLQLVPQPLQLGGMLGALLVEFLLVLSALPIELID